jgi:alanyl-tRNA synthetase
MDFAEFREKCLSLIDGKGGGRGPLWQGSGGSPGKADEFLKAFESLSLKG